MSNWKRNLYILWFSQFIAMMGMSMVVPFLPLYVRELGIINQELTIRWSGLVFSGPFLMSFFLVPIWGYLGDKYGRKLMVVRAVFGLGLAQLINGSAQNIYHLLGGRIIQGLMSGFIPASMALISSTTPKNKTGYALGIIQTATSGGTILGPIIGGFLADQIGIRTLFFITSVLCFIAGVLVIVFIKEEKLDNHDERSNLFENFRFVFNSKELRLLLLMIVTVQISIAFNQPLFALYAKTLNINKNYLASVAGILYGIMGIFMMFGSPFWGRLNEKKLINRSLFIASTIAGLSYICHFFIYNPYYLALIRSFLGFSLGGVMPVIYTLVSHNSPQEREGGLMGIASSAQILGNLIGPTLSGIIASHIGIRPVFTISGTLLVIVGLVSKAKIKN